MPKITFLAPKPLHDFIELMANENGWSKTDLIRRAIENYQTDWHRKKYGYKPMSVGGGVVASGASVKRDLRNKIIQVISSGTDAEITESVRALGFMPDVPPSAGTFYSLVSRFKDGSWGRVYVYENGQPEFFEAWYTREDLISQLKKEKFI